MTYAFDWKYSLVYFWRYLVGSFMGNMRNNIVCYDRRHTAWCPMLQGGKTLVCSVWQKGRSEFQRTPDCQYDMDTPRRLGNGSRVFYNRRCKLYHHHRYSKRNPMLQDYETRLLPVWSKGLSKIIIDS